MKKILLILAVITATATAQNISYGDYMRRVMEGNISLAARKLDIEIADAGLKSSKVYNDPTLAITYTNNEDWDKKLGQGIEIELNRSFTFGVRRSRIDLAESERRYTIALFEEYMRNFRADATIAYLEHLRAAMILEEANEIHSDICDVAANDSIRFCKGDIAESDWLESRMAEGIARNTVLEAEAELSRTSIKLGYYMGCLDGSDKLRGKGSLVISEEAAPLDYYTNAALEHRADLIVALSRVDIAETARKFNSALRRPDLNVTIGATYNKARPDFTTLKAGIALPLKFSNFNKGARIADEVMVKQANIEIEEARIVVEADVMQAYSDFKFAQKQNLTFSEEMLADMRNVVENKRKAYELGETAFLDYLIVQRNESEMRREYIDALFGKAVAWVELQRATGFSLEFGAMPIDE